MKNHLAFFYDPTDQIERKKIKFTNSIQIHNFMLQLLHIHNQSYVTLTLQTSTHLKFTDKLDNKY